MLQPSLALFSGAFLLITSLTALGLGGSRERTGAALYLMTCLMATTLNMLSHNLVLSCTITNITCLAGFVILCWKSASSWPFWASGAQLISIMAGLYSLSNSHITTWTYRTVLLISTYSVLIALLMGTFDAFKGRNMHLKASE